MSKYPAKRAQRALREVETAAVEVMRPADSFFRFRYSQTEISAVGGKARVKSRQRAWRTASSPPKPSRVTSTAPCTIEW